MDGFDGYLDSLAGSWRALAVPLAGAQVIRDDGIVAAVFPGRPVFNNAIVLDPARVDELAARYAGAGPFALWSHRPDTAQAIEAAGYVRSEVTFPMVARLDDLPPELGDDDVRSRVDAAAVARLNGVGPELLAGVPGLRVVATVAGDSGAVLIEVDRDVNVSFVATRADRRQQGRAGRVLNVALHRARADGFATSSLQATPMAVGLYRRLGYRKVATWQEWIPG